MKHTSMKTSRSIRLLRARKYTNMATYIHTHTHTYAYVCVYIYIHILYKYAYVQGARCVCHTYNVYGKIREQHSAHSKTIKIIQYSCPIHAYLAIYSIYHTLTHTDAKKIIYALFFARHRSMQKLYVSLGIFVQGVICAVAVAVEMVIYFARESKSRCLFTYLCRLLYAYVG